MGTRHIGTNSPQGQRKSLSWTQNIPRPDVSGGVGEGGRAAVEYFPTHPGIIEGFLRVVIHHQGYDGVPCAILSPDCIQRAHPEGSLTRLKWVHLKTRKQLKHGVTRD